VTNPTKTKSASPDLASKTVPTSGSNAVMNAAMFSQKEKVEDTTTPSLAPHAEKLSSSSGEAEVVAAVGPKCLTALAAQLDSLEASLLSSLAEVRNLRQSCP